nr:hypothetical protein [Tanacetum cinerariifolium]
MRDEHLNTISETESDKFIKSSVENLVPNPNESEDLSDSECDEIYSNPLFDEEIISMKIDPHHSNVESDLIESLLNQELLRNDSLSLPENELFHFDIPSSSLPPAKPPDNDSGILTVKVLDDIFELYVPMPRLLPTQPTLASNQEKSPHLLSHRGLKASQLHSKSSMMISEGNTHILDVPFIHFYPLNQLKYWGN